ncbi:uncharacterized protein CEXT_481711 [Caerostris extrusa]|uniref:Ciliary microtubule inner protein 2A-C-like domain-containing protein n=1 Tax=Caerostris extrusa TaxID=172846 RepID=A0AAV4SKP4_CAEEX|nr:uncharacterized protein CEXT_481711 [Caerostris extrusa]
MTYYRNPHTHLRVPEPHFIPGYTGFCPNMPDKIGIPYSWATHDVMHEQPDISMRLSAMKPPPYLYAFQVPGKDFRGDRKCDTSTTRGVCGCSTYSPKTTHQHEVHVDCTGDKSDRGTGDQGIENKAFLKCLKKLNILLLATILGTLYSCV